MTVRLEHANLFVRDIDATIRFRRTAFPEFRIRFDGKDPRGFRWVHIGTDDTYRTSTLIESEYTSTTPTATIGSLSSICQTIQRSDTITDYPTIDMHSISELSMTPAEPSVESR